MTEPDYTDAKIWAYPGKSWIALAQEMKGMNEDERIMLTYTKDGIINYLTMPYGMIKAKAWDSIVDQLPTSARNLHEESQNIARMTNARFLDTPVHKFLDFLSSVIKF